MRDTGTAVQGTYPRQHNFSAGEQAAAAVEEAGLRKADALRSRKLAERTFDRILLTCEGKNIAEREAKARTNEKYIVAEDAAIEAESEAIIAKAKADAAQLRFEEWRTQSATARAEMNIR